MEKPKIVWQEKSRHALVTCYDNGIVEKVISPENVNTGNASWVNKTSRHFREGLRDLGVLIAEPYTFEERDGKAIQNSPCIGENLEKIFKEGRCTSDILNSLFFIISGVLEQESREVGIDARLSNFCLGKDGYVYYVDTFPVLVKYKGEFLVHFPNPTDPELLEQELQRKFDPFGILRRLRFSILAQDGGVSDGDILDAIECAMGTTFSRQVRDFFNSLPDNKDVEVALSELSLDDPDAVRELALRFMPPKGEERTRYFETIFDLSSRFCPLQITAEERLVRIRELFVS